MTADQRLFALRWVLCRATYPHLTDKVGLRAGPTYLLNPPRRASSLGPTYLPLAPPNKGVISAQPKRGVRMGFQLNLGVPVISPAHSRAFFPEEIAFYAWMTRTFSLCAGRGMRRSDGMQIHSDACRCMQMHAVCTHVRASDLPTYPARRAAASRVDLPTYPLRLSIKWTYILRVVLTPVSAFTASCIHPKNEDSILEM